MACAATSVSLAGLQAASGSPRPNPRPASGDPVDVVLTGVPGGATEDVIKRAVREAAEAVTDFSWLSAGDTVFIKPALNSGKPYPATTSPWAIAAVVKLLREKGAGRVIVGDMAGIEHTKLKPDGISGTPSRKLCEDSGMASAAQAAGAELHFFDEAGWSAFYGDAPPEGSHWRNPIMIPTVLNEADHIILMPRCGRHALCGSSLGLKAVVGYMRTDSRLEYHRRAKTLHEKTAEANFIPTLARKQRFVLSAADKTLTTFGPDHGHVITPTTGLITASESVVAHDMVSLAWLLETRRQTPSWKFNMVNDPYTSQLVVGLANRYIVMLLGGIGPALGSDTLARDDLESIWDDRTLNRACELVGGVPSITLVSANDVVPDDVKARLREMVTPM